jgi:hypothetical protein
MHHDNTKSLLDAILDSPEAPKLVAKLQSKLHFKSNHGTIESHVVQGFSIDIRAIFDEQANMEALKKILNADS